MTSSSSLPNVRVGKKFPTVSSPYGFVIMNYIYQPVQALRSGVVERQKKKTDASERSIEREREKCVYERGGGNKDKRSTCLFVHLLVDEFKFETSYISRSIVLFAFCRKCTSVLT